MGTDIGHLPWSASSGMWQVEAAQLLEEHHAVAWSHQTSERRRFTEGLAASLGRMSATQVCLLPGEAIRDIFSFCTFLERALGVDRVRRSIDARGGVVDSLRRVTERRGGVGGIRHRYIVWQDAHVLLRADHKLFGRLADALMGVSAEFEYSSEDLLVIQRVVFAGGPSLDMYAEDARGQFRRWYTERDEEPLWATITGVKAPPVLRYRVDQLMDDHAADEPVLASVPARRRSRSA
jgi:hypothetical protein